jgi:hypothetical protein
MSQVIILKMQNDGAFVAKIAEQFYPLRPVVNVDDVKHPKPGEKGSQP